MSVTHVLPELSFRTNVLKVANVDSSFISGALSACKFVGAPSSQSYAPWAWFFLGLILKDPRVFHRAFTSSIPRIS